MEVVPFQDYSDVLVPLPPLGGYGSSTPSSPSSREEPSFRDRLKELVEAEPVDDGKPSQPVAASPPRTAQQNPGNELTTSDGLDSACRDLEGFLLALLLRNLSRGFGGSTLFSRSWESSVYKDMFFFEIAKAVGSRPPGLGISEAIRSDIMLKAKGTSNPGSGQAPERLGLTQHLEPVSVPDLQEITGNGIEELPPVREGF